MEIDLAQLRRQYENLTDEALLEVERDELVDSARQCYDEELAKRRLRARRSTPAGDASAQHVLEDFSGEEPEWAEDGLAALSLTQTPGNDVAPDIAAARSILAGAGIPYHLATREPQESGDYTIYELLVPPGQHLLALSVLDKEFFNPQMEAEWKAHFETMTDQDLLDLDADALVAGMRDRVERLVRTYEDELLKRGLAELETDSSG